MIKLRDIAWAGTIVAAAALAPALVAQTVTLQTTPYSFSAGGETGGEFEAQTTLGSSFSPPISLANYNSKALYGSGFETFCVESTVTFSPGTTYNLALSMNALGSANPLSPFALSVGTAYLYEQFALGTLSGYNYATSGTPSRKTDAGELQAAIWYLEKGQVVSGFPSGITSNPYYTDALNYVQGLGYTATELTASATLAQFGVEIMNLTSTSGSAHQNQLVYVGGAGGLTHQTIPDGGVTLALLGLSLAGLAVFARRSSAVQRAR